MSSPSNKLNRIVAHLHQILTRSRKSKSRPLARRPLLGLERLEDRVTPAQLTVTSAADPATLTAGTLRYEVNQANSDAAAGVSDTIVFNTTQMDGTTVTLSQGQLELKAGSGTTTINGGGQITVNANAETGRIFQIDSSAHAVLSNLTIAQGYVANGYGGGISNIGNLTLINDILTDDHANVGSLDTGAGDGGGIYNNGTLNLIDSTLSDNYAEASGGGIYNDTAGTLTVLNSSFENNSANGGGGGAINNTGVLMVINSTITSNTSTFFEEFSGGGGIYDSGGTMTVSFCTISGNFAEEYGGGIYAAGGSLTMLDTIVAGNTTNTSGPDLYGSIPAGSDYNLIGNGSGMTGISNGVNNNQVGTSGSPINPMLTPLGNYGGPTQTMALLPGSPALGAGNLASVPSEVQTVTVTGSAGTFTLTFGGATTSAIAFNATAATVQTALNFLPSIGGVSGNVTVTKSGTVFTITFGGSLAATNVSQIIGVGSGGATVATATLLDGNTDQRGYSRLPRSPDIGAFQTQASPFLVTTASDPGGIAGQLSLREAVNLANAYSAAGSSPTITFASSLDYNNITLSQGVLELTAGSGVVTIDGSIQITVSGVAAGGFQVDNGAHAVLTDLTIQNSNAGIGNGGGINNSGTLTLSNDTLENNFALDGGGIDNSTTGTLTVLNSFFEGNSSFGNDGGGGAIYNSGVLTVGNSTFTDNSTFDNGGAIDSPTGSVTLTNCTFADNSTTGSSGSGGGAIYDGGGTMSVSFCTISGNNTSVDGGGIYAKGALTLVDTIVAGNSATSAGPDVYGSIPAGSYNDLIGNGSGVSGISNGANRNQVGTSASPINPKLAALDYYGGPTETAALLPGSPAIGAGATVAGITTDQRGFGRPGGNPDIGAYQTQAAPFLVTTAGDPGGSAGQLSLREAVDLANAFTAAGNSPTITFASGLNGDTITSTFDPLELTAGSGTTTINGGGQITINGDDGVQIFIFDPGARAILTGMTIENGTAGFGDGGGISNSGTLTVSNDTLSGNSAEDGGGINNNGTLTVVNTTISNNMANGIFGGGIYNTGTMTLNQVTLSGNSASVNGGGISNTGSATISNSTLTGNSATNTGGGIDNSGTLTLSNSTLTGNSASNFGGGGIFEENNTGNGLSVSFCTISGNSGGTAGGGIYAAGNLTLQDTIVAGNTTSVFSPDIAGVITTDDGYNLLGTAVNSSTTDPTPGPHDIFSDTPRLASLASNGGPTQTMALLSGSPAIGAGVAVAGITTDQRSNNRPNPPDIGAYQSPTEVLASIGISAPSTATAGSGFSVTVTAKNQDGSGYNGGVTLSCSDGQTVSPTTVTLTGGSATVNVTLDKADAVTLSGTSGSITGTSGTVTVSAGAANHLGFFVQPSATSAGTAIGPAVKVQLFDQYGNLLTGDNSDQVTLFIAGGPGGFAAGTNATQTVSGGIASFGNLVLDTAGSYTLGESATGGLSGPNSASFVVSPAGADHLGFSVQPSNTTAGSAVGPAVEVNVLDKFGNLLTGDNSDQVTLSVAGGPGAVAAGGTATASGGVATFGGLVLDTSGSYTLAESATGGLTGANSSSFTVSPAAVHSISVSAPGTATAGTAFSVTITATDQYGNGYSGNVSLTSSDSQSVSPSTITLTGGTATANVTLDKANTVTLSASAASITGTSGNIVVNSVGVASINVSAPSTATAGDGFSVTITATDQHGNGYNGSVTLSASDGQSVSPTSVTLSNGTATTTVTLDTADTLTLTGAVGSVTGTSGSIAVSPAAVHTIHVGAPSTATAGNGFGVTITATDQFGNGYNGNVTLAASDSQSVSPSNVTLSNGTATTTVTLDKADAVQLSATAGSVTGTSNSIAVSSAAAASISVSAPSMATASNAFSITITATDQFGNGYDGNVTLTSSDGQTVSPTNVTLTGGPATVHVTLNEADTVTLTAAAGSVTGTSGSITVVSAGVTSVSVSAPSTATAGTAFSVTVTATDQDGSGYNGTVMLTASDGQRVSPASVSVSNGTATVNVTLDTTDTLTLTGAVGSVTGTSGSITVVSAAAATISVSAPGTATAGTGLGITITAKDPFGNGYDGNVTLTASDDQSVTPTTVTLNNGTANATVTLDKVDSVKLSATSGSVTGISGSITVGPGAVNSISVNAPSAATAGSSFTISVTAMDQFGNGCNGNVNLTSSDGQGVTPSTVTLTGGSATTAVTLDNSGSVKLSATAGSVTGTSASITVSPAAVNSIRVSVPSTATAGTGFSVTITAKDQYGNGYNGNVTLTASDSQSVSPASVTLSNGSATATVTLDKAESVTLSASADGVTGTSSSVAVSPAAVQSFSISAPSTATAGTGFSVTVTAMDPFNNPVSSYSGNVTLTASDSQNVSPGNVMLSNGVATTTVKLDTADTVKLSGSAGSSKGTSGTISVSPATPASISVNAPGKVTAGNTFSVGITALDQYNNTLIGDSTDPVTLSIAKGPKTVFADGNATESANFSSGVATFSTLQLFKTGNYTIDATPAGSLSGIPAVAFTLTVNPGPVASFAVNPNTSNGVVTAGQGFSVSVLAIDKHGNTVGSYDNTVTLSASDNQSVSPSTVTVSNGSATVQVILYTPEKSLTLTAAVPGIQGTSASFTVSGGAIFGPPLDSDYKVDLYAYDSSGNLIEAGQSGSVVARDNAQAPYIIESVIAPDDQQAMADITDQESIFFQQLVALGYDVGQITTLAPGSTTAAVVVTPIGQSSGVSEDLVIVQNGADLGTPGSVASFALSVPASDQANAQEPVTVTALDANGNVVAGYTGTVSLASSDPQFGAPISYTFTAADQGSHIFTVNLDTAGIQALTVTQTASGMLDAQTMQDETRTAQDAGPSTLSGQALVDVTPAAAASLVINVPAMDTTGTATTLSVTAMDPFGNVASGYSGTVFFQSLSGSLPSSGLPASYTFIPTDHGSHNFAVTFKTAGSRIISASDHQDLSLISQTQLDVTAVPAKLLIMSPPPPNVTAGSNFGLVVEAVDSHGNPVGNFNGLVTMTLAGHPAGALLGGVDLVEAVNGVATFSALTLNKAGAGYSVKASAGSLTAVTSGQLSVTAGAAATVVVISQPPGKVVAGSAFGVKVEVEDADGNVISSYSGSVTLSLSSGPSGATLGGTLTANVVNGVATFSGLRLAVAGTGYSLSAASGSLSTATSKMFSVSPGAATQLMISTQPPASVSVNSGFGLAVAALDAYGNVVTSFTGKVTLSLASNPGFSTLGGKVTLSAVKGVATFTGLMLNVVANGYTIKTKSGNLTTAVTNAIDVLS